MSAPTTTDAKRDTTTTIIDQLVNHVLDTPFEAFSEETIEAAKMRLVDALGCTVSGSGVAQNDALTSLFQEWGGAPQATVLGSGLKLPLAQAAMINSLQTRSFDFEVCGPEPEGINRGKMVGHVASTTEPTALNVGEYTHADGKELLAAVILGGDVAARISVSNTFNFDADFEVCGTSNTFGATAVVGRLMGLSHEQLRNAFGIALNLMAGSYQGIWDGAHSFKLPGAQAAYNGVISCQMSLNGFKGVDDALESRLGFFHLYCKDPHPENMLADLGEVYYVKGQHKMHPSCYGNHNPIEAALFLREEHDFNGADVAEVVIGVPPNRLDHFLNQVATVEDEQPKFLFTIPYGVANALYRGRPELVHYTQPQVYDPEVLDLVTRVRLEATLPLGKNQSVHLRVKLKDGAEYETYRENPTGWLDDPVTMEQVVEKYWRNLDFAGMVNREDAARALDMLRNLEQIRDVAIITPLLTANKTH
ncbi:MmgE/PrpD family protein [Corynebacterium occultum]|uniref:MmgE/PrpD family protein n=1 Tax=Corynebacterium occultum TaxID=2675219 RepID=A0A6B8W6J5_9CORY|nr:MmgE/PrpD family protein [Corynebacterium occultum]QGU08231.1 MmgE/PrpD family protein [Corynebacterium occultum]